MSPVREDPQLTRSPAERASSRQQATRTDPRSKDGIPSSRGRSIFVAGYYGFANAGDEAILKGMLDALRHLRSDLDIVVLSGNPEQTSVSHRVRSVLFTDVPALVEAAASAELLLLGGGGLFHDHFGFAADTVLCPDHGGLALFSGIPLLASLLEKPLMIFGAGVGPLKTAEAREFTKFAFDQCRIATVRNSASRAELLTMGVDGSRVRVLPDPAFIMEPALEEEIRPLLERSFPAGERPLLGVALRNWTVSVDAEAWEREVAEALDVFLDVHAGRALLVPLQELTGDLVDDRAVARRVQARMQHGERTVIIEAVDSPMRKAALLGRCQVVLGMRLHSLIFALRAGVPPVALAYDDKVLCLAEEAGLAELVLPIHGLTSEAIVSRLERALRDRQEMAPRLAAEAARRAELARENARLALSVLDGDIPAGEDRGDAVHMLKRVTLGLSRQATAYHAEIRRQAAQHAEGVAYLRDRIAALEDQLETIYQSRAWRWVEKYRRARLRLRALAPRRAALACRGLARRWLPVSTKRALRRIWKPGVEGPATPLPDDAPAWGEEPSRYDVVCFSIIDWDFRWQRPQQLMSQFAEHGHRVFFISPSRFRHRGEKPYSIRPLRENVWEVQLTLPRDIHVYSNVLSDKLAECVVKDLAALRSDRRIETGLSIVQVATWGPAARRARELFSWRIVYDCMDEWHNFPGIGTALLDEEERLVHDADVLVVSAEKLREKWSGRNGHTILARNAADFLRFNQPPPDELLPDVDGPVVGYFGAIADWFDLELMTRLARERPRYTFVLLGGVFGVPVDELETLPNVRLLGQKPYELMPLYLRRFDACLIPFKVSPITAATDPVKFYEYVSQGKPVVASQMPELAPYARLLYLARNHEDFIAKVDQALNENDPELRRQRMDLARENTWQERFGRIDRAVREVHPAVSIVIVTYENLEYTRRCLDSVFRNTSYPRYEVIVVDNGSRDGTREYLEALPATYPGVRAILNNENLGFARANNQGLRMAIGQRLVLLNNDTVVPRGWLTGLLRHLERPEVGLVVSVTNFSGNESRIEVPYTDLAGMDAFAWRHCRQHEGEWFDIRVAAMYCLGMRRDAFERVGDLDERFGVGLFEDDDYSHRMRLSGYRVICAEDVFVHHYGQASFKKLSPREYQTIWNRNQRLYEEKWGTKWTPHTLR